MACALWWTVRRDWWLLVAAALLAGSAPLVKQSAIDGIVVVGAAALLVADRRLAQRRDRGRGRRYPGADRGRPRRHRDGRAVSDWWYAIVGYRSSTESAVSGDIGARLQLLVDSVPPALQDLLPMLVLAPLGLRRGQPAAARHVAGGGRRRDSSAAGSTTRTTGSSSCPCCRCWRASGSCGSLHLPLAVKLAFALTLVPVVAYSAEVYTTRARSGSRR